MGGPQWAKSQHGGIYLHCAHFLSAAYHLPSCLPDGSHGHPKLACASKLNLFHARPVCWQPLERRVLFNHILLSWRLIQGLCCSFQKTYLSVFSIKELLLLERVSNKPTRREDMTTRRHYYFFTLHSLVMDHIHYHAYFSQINLSAHIPLRYTVFVRRRNVLGRYNCIVWDAIAHSL